MKFGVFTTIVGILLFAWSTALGFAIRGFVIANGGRSAIPAASGMYRVFGTVGQPAIGVDNVASQACSGFWCFGGPGVVAVDPRGGGGSLPTAFALGPATPNPARDHARFRLALPKAAMVTLRVYDVSGRQVGDEVSRQLDAGEHELFWRAPSAQSGIYFVQLATDGVLAAKRTIVLVR